MQHSKPESANINVHSSLFRREIVDDHSADGVCDRQRERLLAELNGIDGEPLLCGAYIM
jgi:hypothetical protein